MSSGKGSTFWQSTVPQASILIVLLLGLISFHYWWGEREDGTYLRLSFAAVVWAISNSMFLGDFLDADASRWFGALNDAATNWLACALVLFAVCFDRERWPRVELGLVAYAVIMTLMTLPIWQWSVKGVSLQYYANILVTLPVLCFFSWRAYAGGSHEFRVVMLALWSVLLMSLHSTYYITCQEGADEIAIYPYAAFSVFGAFLYVMQRRYLHARHALVDLNASLDARLRQREAELAEQHRRLMLVEQDRVVQQERQRLMRDMHDGIGTTLMSSLAAAKNGRLGPEHAAEVLREALDELKLVIDSLEPIEDDVATLLAALRFRFGKRIEDAGVKIVWKMAELPPLPWLDSTHALQVLRIVQETLTNVIKHAQATRIEISAELQAGEDGCPCIVVGVADNGVGFDPLQPHHGRGLDNLLRRAKDLGARIDIHSLVGQGTRVSLFLPLRLPA